jgi:hypothetical protein
MKLRTATIAALTGAIILLVSYVYTLLLNVGIIELHIGNYKTHYTIIGIFNVCVALSFINFFVSFLNAQRKRG